MPMTVAVILGLEAVTTPMALIRQIEAGLPMSAFILVAEAVALNEMPPLAISPRATLTRRNKSQRLSPNESDVVARIASVWQKAVEVYKDKAFAKRFLHQPHPLLEGDTPISIAARTSAGATLVEQILGQMQYSSAP